MREVAEPAVAFLAEVQARLAPVSDDAVRRCAMRAAALAAPALEPDGVAALAKLLASCRVASLSSAASTLSRVLADRAGADGLLPEGMVGFVLSGYAAPGMPALAAVVEACRAAGGAAPEAQAHRLATLGVAFMLD
ncbi:hypothetical protein JYK14_24415 [Siccirubricoccus sp. KC 17139]|uniref:DUF2877 domain-containing protein n=1 Tax=Siccirubricoccus soli TaxID=2899147 RepID=A0ABT1DDL6_9PROT|nr:hypothetical protein [Siccirubricoccus soli]MCO6419279.1 hypothetical protein [Siccirubricoccus soli]MCP2685414.1 hypothetical protein [Siccirubricoccus soli]